MNAWALRDFNAHAFAFKSPNLRHSLANGNANAEG
jgi:hypothetical protein